MTIIITHLLNQKGYLLLLLYLSRNISYVYNIIYLLSLHIDAFFKEP